MKRYKFTFVFLILLICLGLPFILKLKDSRLEIYPAVILPSGANLTDRSGEFVSVYQIKILDSSTTYSKEEFMDPIPSHFFNKVFKNNFGLEQFRDEFKLYKPPVRFIERSHFSEKGKESAKKFWRKNINSDYFIIQEQFLKINLSSKKVVDSTIIRNTFYDLR